MMVMDIRKTKVIVTIQISIPPNAEDIAGDGIDQDCDGSDFNQIIRFVALGDAGEGNDAQHAVGDAMKSICDSKADDIDGCFFAIYLGDNFYESGVDGVDDPQFQVNLKNPTKISIFLFISLWATMIMVETVG